MGLSRLVENNTSAWFPSDVHAPPAKAGKFQLKIDLFDGSGNLIDIDAVATKTIFVVPEELDLSQPATVHTEDADTLNMVLDDDGDGLRSFILTLHVDNTACQAAIEPAKLGLVPANSCGVLPYDTTNTGQTVSMLFKALHDSGHATYEFTLKRGVTGLSGLAIGGSNPLVHPRALPPGNFANGNGQHPDHGLPGAWPAALQHGRLLRTCAGLGDGHQRLAPAERI
ncbi:MAG: hypothetical protein IPF96_18420 [Rhodobacter sp.]|nr:hypothetical protein [Rhodobacter sp.]